MAKREWVGTYWLHVEVYHSYKGKWIWESCNLGKCLCEDEACIKAADYLMREYPEATVRDAYILDGWGNKFYAKER